MVINLTVLVAVAAVWAFTFIFVKIEEENIGPITIMAGRALIAFAELFVISLLTRQDLRGHIKDIWKFIVFAVLGVTVLWIFLAQGQEHISAGLASVMPTMMPLMTFVILVLILRDEPFSYIGLVGLLLGVAGIILVVGLHEVMAGGSTVMGVVYIAAGFAFFAVNGILVGKWAKDIHPLVTTTYFLFFGTIILCTVAFIFEDPTTAPWTTENYLEELVLGLICTGAGYYGYYYLIQRAGAYFASFIFYLLPIFGVLAGILLLGNRFTVMQLAGIPIVLFGVYLINREKFRQG
jgi:drug/metabolite transporter (DMT)-like permease